MAEYLSELRGAHGSSCVRRRGARSGACRSWRRENARLALDSETRSREAGRLRRIEALEELREALNLESLPIRIECFDVSNLQESAPVASMVVFRDGVPSKAHYRKFAAALARPGRATSPA